MSKKFVGDAAAVVQGSHIENIRDVAGVLPRCPPPIPICSEYSHTL